MLKTPVNLSEYEDIRIESNIQTVKEILDDLESWQQPHLYTVLEYFPPEDEEKKNSYSPNIYEVLNLTMELEDGLAFCDGYLFKDDKKLSDIICPLSAFTYNDDTIIGIHNNKITITFDCGFIQILY